MRLWLSFFLLLPASCMNNNGIPSDVIKPVEMQHVMWDMICADNLAQEQANKDSTLNLRHQNIQLLNEVFAIHRIKRSEFSILNFNVQWTMNSQCCNDPMYKTFVHLFISSFVH